MATVRSSFEQVKQQFREFLNPSIILQVCREQDYQFRQRVFGPVETIIAFCLQVMHGNIACVALRHWLGSQVTDAAYCQARKRLPLVIFRKILSCLSSKLDADVQTELWKGRRTFLIDGSNFSMPDTPDLQESFGQPPGQKAGCGFPLAGLLVMVHWSTGLVLDLCTMPWRQHEQSKVCELHRTLRSGDILVADRGFCSYVHLAQLCQKGIDMVFRVHQRTIIDFTPGRANARGKGKTQRGLPRSRWIRALGETDQIVRWKKPPTCPKHLSQEAWNGLPNELTIRELSYRIEAPGYRTRQITLVTTLLDTDLFSIEDLSDLYLMRWRIELNFRDLKTTMGLDVLKCKTTAGVLKELYVFAMIYNMVMSLRYRVARSIDVVPWRISFVDTLRHIRVHGFTTPDTLLVNPERTGRWQPRVIKRRAKPYPLMTKPRHLYVIGEKSTG